MYRSPFLPITIALLTATSLCLAACSEPGHGDGPDQDVGLDSDSLRGDAEDSGSDDGDTGTQDAGAEDTKGEDAGDDTGTEDAGGDGDTGQDTDHCEGRQLPSDWLRLTTGSLSCRHSSTGQDPYPFGWIEDADCRYFEGIYPWSFDERQSVQRVLGTRGGLNDGRQYIAIEFDSGDVAPDQTIQFSINIPQVYEMENRSKLFTISTCPGDFNEGAIEQEMGLGCYFVSWVNNLQFGGTDYFDSVGRCALQPNSIYYLNVLHVDGDTVGGPMSELEPHPDCIDTNCGFRMTPSN